MFNETIAPEHEYRHAPDDDPTYNESTYYNFSDPSTGLTGWLRVAMQANQPANQASVLLFLPDGQTLFEYYRGSDVAAKGLTVGGLTFEILAPHQQQRLTYDGQVASFAEPRTLGDKGAYRTAPKRHVAIDLNVTAHGPSFGTNGDDPDNYLEETMALGHFEQFIRVNGNITVDSVIHRVAGGGLRDHSWGPRDWAGPSWYRWATAEFDDGSALMALFVARRDGTFTRQSGQVRDGGLSEVELADVTVEWTEDGFARVVTYELSTTDGPLTVTATVRQPEQFAPLRHQRTDDDGTVLETRIGYASYDFTTTDGRRGTGIVEVLDQMIDGLPQGMRDQAVTQQ